MAKDKYGVVLDAGSSGTRLYVYKWKDNKKALKSADKNERQRLPVLKTHDKWTTKISPGLSTNNENPSAAGPYLKDLVDEALKIVPSSQVSETPFFLLATAGMRLLKPSEQKAILSEVCSYVQNHTEFLINDCASHIQIIDGKTEGLYGWLAANYLIGGFDEPSKHEHGGGHHTYGFLDMGGASAQIAFAPNATESEKHGNDLTLVRLRSIDGKSSEYRVFLHSWLGFGAHEARSRYLEQMLHQFGPEDPHVQELPDPCLPAGLRLSLQGSEILDAAAVKASRSPYLQGTGNFKECLAATYPLLGKDLVCEDDPCLFDGVHVPSIDFGINHFVGVSEYWHTTHQVFETDHNDKAYDYQTYQRRVNEFCSQPWADIEAKVSKHEYGKKVDGKTAAEVCFKASWLINVLHDGIGIPRGGIEADLASDDAHNTTKTILDQAEEKGYLAPFRAVNDIGKTEVSWTLGKMVLYASSQVVGADGDDLPVGFGSNVRGIPSDFVSPMGKLALTAPPGTEDPDMYFAPPPKGKQYGELDSDTDSDDEDWHKKLLGSDLGGRVPGLLLFLLIVIIAGLLLCGKERRSNLYRKLLPFRRGASFRSGSQRRRGGKFPFLSGGGSNGKDNGGRYERVLEEGELVNPGDFELNDISSEEDAKSSRSSGSSNGARNGRMRTPGRPGVGLSGGSSYFSDSLKKTNSSSSQGLGLGIVSPGEGNSAQARRSPALGLGEKETID